MIYIYYITKVILIIIIIMGVMPYNQRGYVKYGERKVSISASIPARLFKLLGDECNQKGVSFSQIVSEKLQQGFTYEKLVQAQEEIRVGTLFDALAEESKDAGKAEGSDE